MSERLRLCPHSVIFISKSVQNPADIAMYNRDVGISPNEPEQLVSIPPA